MKNLILSTAIVLGGLTSVTAYTYKETAALNTLQEVVIENNNASEQDYREIETSEVPQRVVETVKKNYSGASISKAYVNVQREYKLELATADRKANTIYVNENGEEINKKPKKSLQMQER